MYIPAYYYLQSRTNSLSESILLTQQFAPHSEIVDMLFNALEENVLTDDKQHKYDQMIQQSGEYIQDVYEAYNDRDYSKLGKKNKK